MSPFVTASPLKDKVDHESLRQELSLSANLSRQCLNVTINDDDVAEDDEIFWISLSLIRNAAGRYVRYPYRSRATIIILDDDCKPVNHFSGQISPFK